MTDGYYGNYNKDYGNQNISKRGRSKRVFIAAAITVLVLIVMVYLFYPRQSNLAEIEGMEVCGNGICEEEEFLLESCPIDCMQSEIKEIPPLLEINGTGMSPSY